MTAPMMRAYCLNVIKVCVTGARHAMGGMAAQTRSRTMPGQNDAAIEKSSGRQGARGGGRPRRHVGWRIPAWVPVALRAFNRHMPQANQIDYLREDVRVTADDLLEVPQGSITTEGLQQHPGGRAISRSVARRQRLRAAV